MACVFPSIPSLHVCIWLVRLQGGLKNHTTEHTQVYIWGYKATLPKARLKTVYKLRCMWNFGIPNFIVWCRIGFPPLSSNSDPICVVHSLLVRVGKDNPFSMTPCSLDSMPAKIHHWRPIAHSVQRTFVNIWIYMYVCEIDSGRQPLRPLDVEKFV